MNLRNVLKVYGLQRQFNDDESALLKTLQSLNDTERDLLVESLSPAQKKSSKKSAGKSGAKSRALCVTCGHGEASARHSDNRLDNYHPYQSPAGKSQRASGMAAQLNKSLQGQRKATATDDNDDDGRCTYKVGEDAAGPIICNTTVDNNVHHKQTDPDYHEFVAPPTTTGKSDAQSAAGGGD